MRKQEYERYLKLNYYQIENEIVRIIVAEKDLIKTLRGCYESPLREVYKKKGYTEKIDDIYASVMYYGLKRIMDLDEEIMTELHETKVRVGRRNKKLDKVLWQGHLYPFLLLEDSKYCELVIKYLDKYRPCLHEICLKKYGN